MAEKINWGIIGAGSIAQAFARGLAQSETGRLYAVASRSKEKAAEFAAKFPAEQSFGSYEELLADAKVQAVYIATPHPQHAEWSIKAARAGKHLMVEKPIAVNWADAMAIAEAAEIAGVFLMEAFKDRCHPQAAKLVELIRDKAIGDVRLIQASFAFQAGFNAESRIYNNALAGGGILDVGCYTVEMVRLIAGAALGKPFADPVHVSGAGHLGQTGVDEWAAATLKFPGGIIAQVSTGVALNQENAVRIFGTAGNIYLKDPWVGDREKASASTIVVNRAGKPPESITVEPKTSSFALEIDAAGRAIQAGKLEAPEMSVADSLGNARTLDQWRGAIGLMYDIETPKAFRKTNVAGGKVAPTPNNNMKVGRIAHLDKPVSRLVMGVDNQHSLSHAAVMFDDYFEKGGNTFDTGYIYGGGRMEPIMGQWIALRGVRDSVNVIVKGCHTPNNDPIALTWQLHESLGRLKIDTADIYMMHRDNEAIPAGEFVDVLNEHVKAGRIKAFGGSNWSIARVQEANDYAKSKGLQGFSVVSNNFSLARMVAPIWDGCIAASDAESRAWLTKTQIALLPWSSQARGFFVPGRAAPEKKDDGELVRTWYADDNFVRQKRAFELAEKKGVLPINIALAYVLSQPFPTFPLIGPRQLSETRTSLPALDVTLTGDELKWLNLEA